MPRTRNIHVVPNDERWAVIREGTRGPIAYHANRQDATNHARNIARRDRVEMIVYDRENQIRDRENYRETMVNENNDLNDDWTF